ncbi:hypothetical protein [Streptomyces bohaiensis]|uniref:hypothetical protein n=1 Tax=Streptomyces bohaiensis TaxID=1431344 RepID=UPI003B82AC21
MTAPGVHTGRCGAVGGYWAESVARSPEAGGEWYLAGVSTATPGEALRWLHEQADRLAVLLEGSELQDGARQAGYAAPVAAVLREWTRDRDFRRVQCAALAAGHPVSANARGPDRIHDGRRVEVLYSLSARPVPRPLCASGPQPGR